MMKKQVLDQIDLSHSMVHYLMTIHKLKESRGFARVTDIAKDLSLTKGSVSTSLNNLKKRGLVTEEEDCKFVILSDEGHDLVHEVLSSKTLLFYFLRDFLGVSEDIADRDACLMEHLMGDETRTQLFNFMKKVGCSCDEESSTSLTNLKTELDLCAFSSAKDFVSKQEV